MGQRIKQSRVVQLVTLTVVGLILVLFILRWVDQKIDGNFIRFGTDSKIDITPEQITAIRAIGQWEFLTISDEEMVDTIRRGFFTDDELVRIYYGTLRLGVDMQKVSPEAIVAKDDTISVTLPAITLLDPDFIDEARTRSFYQSGNWQPHDREAMYQRARQHMMTRSMTQQNIASARQNGEHQLRQVLQGMGFKNIKIVWEDQP